MLVLGFHLISGSVGSSPQGAPLPVAAPASPGAGPAVPAAALPALPPSPPTRLRIPSIGVDAPFTALALDGSGALAAPPSDDRNLVGWYRGGATPGEAGTSLVVGHVDTQTGPAVFLLLSALTPGAAVDVTRTDGSVARFTVDSVRAFPKDRFPDEEVYADTGDAQLRLITCGGTYDRTRRDYTDNVVAFAHLTTVAP